MPCPTIRAEPALLAFAPERAALLLIDMQRDFLEPGGFGTSLGNDVGRLRPALAPCASALAACRTAAILVVHTREGHRPDLADAPPAKIARGAPGARIGEPGPMGRILVRGEAGHSIVADLAPRAGEPVIDKPGKGAFFQTDLDLDLVLRNSGIDTLFVAGVTTEICVQSTIREAKTAAIARSPWPMPAPPISSSFTGWRSRWSRRNAVFSAGSAIPRHCSRPSPQVPVVEGAARARFRDRAGRAGGAAPPRR